MLNIAILLSKEFYEEVEIYKSLQQFVLKEKLVMCHVTKKFEVFKILAIVNPLYTNHWTACMCTYKNT